MTERKAECLKREGMHSKGRTALLIRCSDAEARLIRAAASDERRTLSGYVLNAVLEWMYHGPTTRDSDRRAATRNGVRQIEERIARDSAAGLNLAVTTQP